MENYKAEAKRAASYIVDKAYEEGYKRGVKEMMDQANKIIDSYSDSLLNMVMKTSLKHYNNMQKRYLIYDLEPWRRIK